MASTLLLPDGYAPSNLHLKPSVKVTYVENDVFDIARRLQAISPRLHLNHLEDEGRHTWVVVEHCVDGVIRKVCGADELDARFIHRVQEMLSVPLPVRVAKLEAENAAWEKQQHDDELERIYDRIGGEMWYQLEHDGFIQRPVSYPKRGITPSR